MRNIKRNKKPLPFAIREAMKWALIVFAAFLLFAVSTTGSTTASKALLLLPFAVAVSVFGSEIPSAAMGGLAGMLIDISQGQLLGFAGFLLCLLCGLISAMFRQFLRKNLLNYIFAVAVTAVLYLYLDYFFYYRIWEYEGYATVPALRLIPSLFKTIAFSPATFLAVWGSDRIFSGKRELEIEENDGSKDRI